jgi:hypothetical protein
VPRPPSADHAAAPYRELAQLSEETCARLQGGDDAFLAEAIARRDVLLDVIAGTEVRPDEIIDVRTAIQHALAMDHQLLALLESRREQARQALAQIAGRRDALQSYRGSAPTGAVYIERLS